MKQLLSLAFIVLVNTICAAQPYQQFVESFKKIYNNDEDFRRAGDLIYLGEVMLLGDESWYQIPITKRKDSFLNYLNSKQKFTIIYPEAYDPEDSLVFENGLAFMDFIGKIPRCIRKRRVYYQSDISHWSEKYQRIVYSLFDYLSNNNIDYIFDIAMYRDSKPMHWIIRDNELKAIAFNEEKNIFIEYEAHYYIDNISNSLLFNSPSL